MFKKHLALILAAVVLLASLPLTMMAFAAEEPDAVKGYEVGSTIYEMDLSGVSEGSVPSGWIYGGKGASPALNFGWGGGNAAVRAKVETFQGQKVLHFGSTATDAVMLAPSITPTDYVYEVTFVATNSTTNVGITNLSWGSTIADVNSAFWFVAKPSTYVSYKGKGVAGVGGETVETKLTNEGDSISANVDVTFKIVSLGGTNYYYINDTYYGSVAQKESYVAAGDGTGGRLGLYTYGGDMYVKSFTVKNLTEKTSTNDNIIGSSGNKVMTKGDSLMAYDFTTSTVADGSLPAGFTYGGANTTPGINWGWGAANASVSAKMTTYEGTKYLQFNAVNCDAIIAAPAVDTRDYVYEITFIPTLSGKYAGISNQTWGTDSLSSSQWFAVQDTKAPYHKYKGTDNSGGNGEFTTSDDYRATIGQEVTLKVVSYDGTNYYFINDRYVTGCQYMSTLGTNETTDRPGLYTYSGNIYIKSMYVNEVEVTEQSGSGSENLPEGIGKIGDEYYFIGDVIYENNFDNETVGTLPSGWSYGWPYGTDDHKTSFGWAANSSSTASAQVVNHATHGKVVQFGSTNTDAFMALPATGTMNYVYEATVVANTGGGNSLGVASNFYDTLSKASGAMYNSVYPNGSKALYQYRGSGTNGEWNPSFNYANGDVMKFKIVSLNGNNYIFFNDVHVATAPWRGGAGSSDNPGFYTYNGNMYITEVSVAAIDTAYIAGEAGRVVVNADNSVDVQFDFSFDKAQPIYASYVSGEYSYDADSNFKFGYVATVADTDVSGTLEVSGENAAVYFANDEVDENDEEVYLVATFENIAKADFTKYYSIRPFVYVDGYYVYGDGMSYTPASLANGAYTSATTDEAKELIADTFDGVSGFVVGPNSKEITFTVFADFHYKAGMYSTSIADLRSIFKRADDSNSSFVISAGDMTNDMKGSPELYETFLGYETTEGTILKAYNVYGNHELESNNKMSDVTWTLTNDPNVVWGTADGKYNDYIGYYYTDVDGFRVIAVDNQYSWNPNHVNGVVVGWDHALPGSWGSPSAANNATRGYDEGANAAANTKTGALGDVQMAWLEAVLMDAAAQDIPCIVVGHAGYSGLGFGGGSSDSDQVRAIYAAANAANPGTVLMSINGHIHTNNQAYRDGVFYFDVNTVRNAWWQSTSVAHYGAEHTYKYEDYDAQGNLLSVTDKSLGSLSMAGQTWFSEDPLSAVVTLNEAGIVSIDGTESTWAYDIVPDVSSATAGTEPRITTGTFWDCDSYGHIEKYEVTADTHRLVCGAKDCDFTSIAKAHDCSLVVENDETKASDADCNNPATYYHSCVCGKLGATTFTSGASKGHSPANSYSKDANGHWNACANCSDKLNYMTHTYDQQVATSDYEAAKQDCDSPATYYYSCVCGAKGTQTFTTGTAAGHNPGTTYEKDANNHWNVCGDCGDPVNTAAHNYNKQVATDAYKATSADCDDAATYYYSCVCGAKGTETFASGTANGHTPKAEWDWNVDEHFKICQDCGSIIDDTVGAHDNQGATCSDFGECTICGRTDYEYAPDVHDLKDVAESEASHDKDGNIAHKQCKDCKKLFDDAGNELDPEDVIVDGGDHDFTGEYEKDEEGHWKECECGGKDTKAAHSFGEWEVTSEPSEVTPGEKARECSDCGFVETALVPATGADAPETGDTANTLPWMLVAMTSILALAGATLFLLRKSKA